MIGTPDRIFDMIIRLVLNLDNLKTIVLDEADEMLGRGFRHCIDSIFKSLPRKVQVCLFSSTMPSELLELSDNITHQPIQPKVKEFTLNDIKQYKISSLEQEELKLDTLYDLLESFSPKMTQAIIFCNTNRRVEWLKERMIEKDFTISFIHSGMDNHERNLNLRAFRS